MISFSGHTVAKGTVTLHNGGALFVEESSSMVLKGNLVSSRISCVPRYTFYCLLDC